MMGAPSFPRPPAAQKHHVHSLPSVTLFYRQDDVIFRCPAFLNIFFLNKMNILNWCNSSNQDQRINKKFLIFVKNICFILLNCTHGLIFWLEADRFFFTVYFDYWYLICCRLAQWSVLLPHNCSVGLTPSQDLPVGGFHGFPPIIQMHNIQEVKNKYFCTQIQN